ncbi:MAG: hypothetical protein PF450_15990, partial [Bacteroidales bacterium]|nr:hypothetical protein [Bacteroidales bacterium]
WYNNYFFLKDIKAAGMYLEKAASIQGAPEFYKTLAARMHLQSGNIISGIVFLTEMLRETYDPNTRMFLQKRLDALKLIAFLEKNVIEYIRQFDKRPDTLSDLVSEGFIEEIPDDPYGGEFYLMENGRVYSTSKLTTSKRAHQYQ